MKRINIKTLLQSAVLLGGMAGLTAAQAQPTLSNIFPDGAYQFQPSTTLSFVANSAVGISDVSVQLTTTKLTGTSLLKTLTPGNGLTLSGATTSRTVTAAITTNMMYTAVISVKDASGQTTSQTLTFDTIKPIYVWEAEDFDYTSNGVSGLFFNNPQTNAYLNLAGSDGVDGHNAGGGNADYRPNACGATEGCGDKTRQAYINTGFRDYDVGWNNSGAFQNYTRTFPNFPDNDGYCVFIRAANGTGGNGTATFTIAALGQSLGTFTIPQTGGWQNYTWVPLRDSNDPNNGVLNLYGLWIKGLNTVRIDVGGGYNANCYMILPISVMQEAQSHVSFSDVKPDGTYLYQPSNTFAFTATSDVGINAKDIIVQLSGTNLLGQSVSTLYSSTTGLTVGGDVNTRTVSLPVTSNTVYNAFVQVTEVNGVAITTNFNFSTITNNYYTFEIEDFDYTKDGVSGLFFDNPQTNAYAALDGLQGVDFSLNAGNYHNHPYRGQTPADGSPATGLNLENAGDLQRAQFDNTGFSDYNTGNNSSGEWANYTRTYPEGIYNVYLRAADGGAASVGRLALVTGGYGTPDQTTKNLGTFSVPVTGGWHTFAWIPLKDDGGNLARFSSTGGAQTLRYITGGDCNASFIMLVPADAAKPVITDIYPNGQTMAQATNVLSFTVSSSAGIDPTGISAQMSITNPTRQVFTKTVTTANGMVVSGTATTRTVTVPLQLNNLYGVTLQATTKSGDTVSARITFDTINATYTFEAEDYDFENGQFIDNPQVNGYSGKNAVEGVDDHVGDTTSGGHGYRASPNMSAENANDLPRAFHAGFQDYDLGNNDAGNWGNYTRTFPDGDFNIYMRVATDGSGSATADLVTAGAGTSSQTLQRLGTFTIPRTPGWQVYTWVALRDSVGNLVKFTGGGVKTLRFTSGGGYNPNFYALVPVDTTVPVLANVYPNGTNLLQGTNTFAFGVSSAAGIAQSDIVVNVNGTDVTGLVITGDTKNWTVSYPKLQPNMVYSIVVTATALNGQITRTAYNFDTFQTAGNYIWEGEDFDYTTNGVAGLFFDNQTGAYTNMTAAIGIDTYLTFDPNVGPFNYRSTNAAGLVPSTPLANDAARSDFSGTDYRISWFGYGSWANYTRHYPAGTYYVWARFTEGAAATHTSLQRVTSGFGTATQTTNVLGTFNVPLTTWDTWEWCQLVDANNKPATVTFDGKQATLRLAGTTVSTEPTINLNFFMLVPVQAAQLNVTAAIVGSNVVLSFPTETGKSYQVLYKNSLSDASWSNVGTAVTGNGSVQSVNEKADKATRFYRVQVTQP